MEFLTIYVEVDEFWKEFEPIYKKQMISAGTKKRDRQGKLSVSEIMTILIVFQTSHFRTFKHFYQHLQNNHRQDFPDLISYKRFVDWIGRMSLPLFAYLQSKCFGEVTGISFIDSTSLKVCRNKRIPRNRVFKDIATRGKTTMGWFFGFKLHLIINDKGELLNFTVTQGHVDDRKPVDRLTSKLSGKMFGDKGGLVKRYLKNFGRKVLNLSRMSVKI